jgi:hypothetical protein
VGYVQDKVRPGNGREGALGYVRYIAIEHMDVRRDCFSFARLSGLIAVNSSNVVHNYKAR